MLPPEIDYEPETPALESDMEAILRLSSLSQMDYDRVRKDEAKRLNIRVSSLDTHVLAVRNAGKETQSLPFAEVEPHPEPVEPADLLDEISRLICQFMVIEAYQADAGALWIAMTWFIEEIQIAPLALIDAPEKACGKTVLLDLFGKLSRRPLPAANCSLAALYRAVELWLNTLLIDEADTFLGDNLELYGVINAGYSKSNGYVLRCEPVGDTYEPKAFAVFSAKALAGIKLAKHLPEATMSRGIIFNLRRKLSSETVSRLRHADPAIFTAITAKLARLAADYSKQVRDARPQLPEQLCDRDQDNWEALLAVAGLAGDDWIKKAEAAALKLSTLAKERTAGTSNELLQDIQSVFDTKRVDKIKTVDLIDALCEDLEAPWATYNRVKPIGARQLVNLLKPYDIKPGKITINQIQDRGYQISSFRDAFDRYISSSTPPDLSAYPPNNDTNTETTRPTEQADKKSYVPKDTQKTDNVSQDKDNAPQDKNTQKTDNVSQDRCENYVSALQATDGVDLGGKTHKTGVAEKIYKSNTVRL